MINSRNITNDDKPFLWNLKQQTIGPYIDKIYGWDEATQIRYFEEEFQLETIKIIQVDGQDAGMYELQKGHESWFLARIEILPAFQNKGIGSTIIKQIITTSKTKNKSLYLQVFKINPAQGLYERLGFVKTAQNETHFKMEINHEGP